MIATYESKRKMVTIFYFNPVQKKIAFAILSWVFPSAMTFAKYSAIVYVMKPFFSTDPTYQKDYYKMLGVPRNADQKEIKKAYFNVSTWLYTSCYIGVDTPLDRHFNMILIVSGKKKESRNPDTFPIVTLVRCSDQQNFTTFVIFSKHQHEHSLNTLTLVRTFDKRQIICSMHELQ